MRQDEILAILKASSEPMTIAQILEAYGGTRRNRERADAANIRKKLYAMARRGEVHRTGYVKIDDGHYRYLWEAVE